MLPCDLTEATFMVREFTPGMDDIDLLAARIQQLLMLPGDVERAASILRKSRFRHKEAFERKFERRMVRSGYHPGDLVLLRNNSIEDTVSIERKVANRYMGPYEVVRRTQGGSYVLAEMNGTPLRTSVAAFRLIPYVQRKELNMWADKVGGGSDQGVTST